MKNLKRTLALAALMGASAGVANATEGWYGRADVGYSVDGDLRFFGETNALQDDWMGSAGFGYAFQNGFRAEAELAYRNNEVDNWNDDASVTSLMFNLYYDFNRDGMIQPYIGAGIGYGRLEFLDQDDSSMAWQAMVGAAVVLSPQWDLDIGYRYFQMPDASLDFEGGVDAEYTHQAVTVGLRYQFAAPPPPPPPPLPPPPPPPPPPPVAAVCPTSDFVVYFEWDRSNLNQAALETIDAAVSRARQCNVGGVLVIGHTDTSGSTAYNQGLSERRASVVRDALVARGISAASIRTEAHGETDLARPTRDGVREPLNRRTAVTISFR
jgi:outer membrane protein OmpA-like peptidoglycan-associated protein